MPDHSPRQTRGPSWSRPMTETQIHPATRELPPAAADDGTARAAVTRLSRPDRSGGTVIERAAILAEAPAPPRILAWVVPHGVRPETAVVSTKRGLHSPRPQAPIRPP